MGEAPANPACLARLAAAVDVPGQRDDEIVGIVEERRGGALEPFQLPRSRIAVREDMGEAGRPVRAQEVQVAVGDGIGTDQAVAPRRLEDRGQTHARDELVRGEEEN